MESVKELKYAETNPERPLGITILGYLRIIGCVLTAFSSVMSIFFGAPHLLILLPFSLFGIFHATAILAGEGWAWTLEVFFLWAGLILGVFNIFIGELSIFSLLINGLILYYMYQVRYWFKK